MSFATPSGNIACYVDDVPHSTSVRSGSLQCDVAESGVTCRDTSTGRGISVVRASHRLS